MKRPVLEEDKNGLALPKATVIFVNWLLTREGQAIFSKNNGTPVLRRDVPTEGTNPVFLVNPGNKITIPDEENLKFQLQMTKVAREVMDAYAK